MVTSLLTSKGQIVIPAKIRKHLKLKKGVRVCISEKDNQIIIQPLTAHYFEKSAGFLPSKGKLTQALLKQRRQDKEKE